MGSGIRSIKRFIMDKEKVRVEFTVLGAVQMVSLKYRVCDIADDLGIWC